MTKHIPVLLEETIAALCLKPGMTVVDATLGGGGHLIEIAKRILPEGRIIAIDLDEDTIERFKTRCGEDAFLSRMLGEGRIRIVHGNYSAIEEAADGISVDAILADLGFSSDQVEEGGRGFSFRAAGPLDMRLDRRTKLTARDIVNGYTERELIHVFREYGEETNAGRIAKAILLARKERSFETTEELAACITEATPVRYRRTGIHPATKVFQALRMEVNGEREHLQAFLEGAVKVLAPGGRLAVITFHSGEDRLVKSFFKQEAEGCVCPPNFPECRCGRAPALSLIRPRFIRPSDGETARNPRARSAILRVAEKTDNR